MSLHAFYEHLQKWIWWLVCEHTSRWVRQHIFHFPKHWQLTDSCRSDKLHLREKHLPPAGRECASLISEKSCFTSPFMMPHLTMSNQISCLINATEGLIIVMISSPTSACLSWCKATSTGRLKALSIPPSLHVSAALSARHLLQQPLNIANSQRQMNIAAL